MHKKEFRELISAMLIGDGTLYVRKTREQNNSAFFQLGHSWKQYDYLIWKCNLIDQIFIEKKLPRRMKIHRVVHTVKNKKYDGYQGRLYWASYFRFLRKKFYPKHRNEKKSIEALLKQIHSPLHLAIWLMDDGNEVVQKYRSQSNNFNSIRRANPYYKIDLGLCDDGEINLVKQWFLAKFQVEPRSFKTKRGHYVIWFKSPDSKKLFKMTSKYIEQIPSMRNKFSESFIKYWAEKPSASSLKEDDDIVQ
jgi:hypothetical protein